MHGHSCKYLPIGIWPIPRKTSDNIIFMDFYVDFSDFSKTAENPFIEPLMVGRENMWKEIRIADRRKNGKFQIGLAEGFLPEGFGMFNLVH